MYMSIACIQPRDNVHTKLYNIFEQVAGCKWFDELCADLLIFV